MKKQICLNYLMALAITVFIVGIYYTPFRFIDGIEEKTYDMRFHMRGPIPSDENIVIVAIDEKSIDELGRFPWPRELYPKLIDKLSEAGVRAILFDIFFSEASSPRADREFARAIKRSGIVVLPVFFEFAKDGSVAGVTKNIPLLHDAAKGITHINMTPDKDGVVRWTPLKWTHEGTDYFSYGLVGAREAMGNPKLVTGDFSFTLGKTRIPVRFGENMLINYTGPSDHYKRYSFSDIINNKVKAGELKDKLLLFGATAAGIYDLRVTPFSNNTPGVEVNAHIIQTITSGNFITRGGLETLIDILAIVILIFTVSSIVLWARPLVSFPLVAFVLAAYGYLTYQLFLSGMWVSMVYPFMGIVLAYTLTASFRFFVLEKSAKQIRGMFSSYVSRHVVEELVKHPEKARVGGETKTITILFSDIMGFTSFSEKHTPKEVVGTLNEYFTEMVDVIMKYDGTLDKFMGDGIMAFWGAPLEQENHAELAVRCSLEMLDRLDKLNKRWASEGRKELKIGIGVNTGEVIVGNLGVEGKKQEYTAIGDSVNITSRIEPQSRAVSRPVITENLLNIVKDIIVAEPMGPVYVKGKAKALNIYAVRRMKD